MFLRTWLPVSDTVLRLVDEHLPSPLTAQHDRVPILYSGDVDDEFADSMRRCDPDGPVMVFISKLFAPTKAKSSKNLTAYGCV